MNENFNATTPSADLASSSISPQPTTGLHLVRLLKSRFASNAGSDTLPVQSLVVEASGDDRFRSDSRALFTLSGGLVTAGVLVGIFALSQRRRIASALVLPVEPVSAPIDSALVGVPSGGVLEGDITKQVVTEEQSLRIPVTHDEVYVERRPLDETALRSSSTPIESAQEMSIPLTKDHLDVQKQVVITDEFTISRHSVADSARFGDSELPSVPVDGATAEPTRLLPAVDSL